MFRELVKDVWKADCGRKKGNWTLCKDPVTDGSEGRGMWARREPLYISPAPHRGQTKNKSLLLQVTNSKHLWALKAAGKVAPSKRTPFQNFSGRTAHSFPGFRETYAPWKRCYCIHENNFTGTLLYPQNAARRYSKCYLPPTPPCPRGSLFKPHPRAPSLLFSSRKDAPVSGGGRLHNLLIPLGLQDGGTLCKLKWNLQSSML
jgi:hypothetical protein